MSEQEINQNNHCDSKQNKFDPMVICNALDQCCKTEMELGMDSYLQAYRELNKFFQTLGTVFSFVASDVTSKIEILEQYRNDADTGNHYASFQSMIKYEQENNLLTDKKRPSGARTALRLHRALKFFSEFMRELSVLDEQGSSALVARECYNRTLAEYHPWYIRKSASLAMYALPSREKLVANAFGGADSGDILPSKAATESMSRLSDISSNVYQAVEKLYNDHDLLDLP